MASRRPSGQVIQERTISMRRSAASGWAALVCLALALRPQLFGISPLFPTIQVELGASFAAVGLLVTVPVLAMGLASFAAPAVASRLGIVPTATLALVVLGVAGLVRAAMPGIGGLLLASVPIGIASGIGGIVLPMIAKAGMPADRVASATGAYTASLQLGGAIAAALMIPVTALAGGWRPALASIAVATLVLMAAWLVLRPRTRLEPGTVAADGSALRANARWLVPTVAAFALMVLLFQGLNAWLPALLVERGWPEAQAGSTVAALVLAQIPGTLASGMLADRIGTRRAYVSIAASGVFVSLVLLTADVPGTLVWVLLAGFAFGVIAPILLVLPVDFGADARAVARSSAAILGFGYVLASGGPFAMGVVRDVTGSFTLSMVVLGGFAVALVAMGLAIPRPPAGAARPAVAPYGP
jgi:CP family cyanate transporter-like MFS transporter